MCSADYDPPKMLVEERRRARKEHRCSECHLPIPVGVMYLHIRGVWDEPCTFKQHLECRELLSFISDKYCGDDESWAYGELRSEVAEYTDDGAYYGEPLQCRYAAIVARYDR